MGFLKKLVAVLFLLAMVVLGALFTLQNTALVPLDLLLVQLPERTLAFWMLLALAAGVFLGWLASSWLLLSARARLMALRKQKEQLALEVDRLRKVGLANSE